MKISLWSMIIDLRTDIGSLLERTLFSGGGGLEQSSARLIDPETLSRLRAELRAKLDALKDSLSKELSESEVYLVMFPLVLLCDEMMMTRLPKEQQTLWFLLQSELFQINYGGDVFYDFVDERLQKPDTPHLVFEVLYYCLSAGFVGKFGFDGSKVQRYKGLLCERIPGATPRKKRRAREPKQPDAAAAVPAPAATVESVVRAPAAAWYYVAALGFLLLALGGVVALSNL